MALGMDPRFDLSRAYWLVAGIAGVNPNEASIGSAAWAEWVVDGDLGFEIDAREIPAGWPTGFIPLGKALPYEQPVDPNIGGPVYHLDPGLVAWAYDLTRNVKLEDTEAMRNARALYIGYSAAQLPPAVLRGDDVCGSTRHSGNLFNKHLSAWTAYWTAGKGRFVMTAIEDTGIAQSLTFLANAGRVDVAAHGSADGKQLSDAIPRTQRRRAHHRSETRRVPSPNARVSRQPIGLAAWS